MGQLKFSKASLNKKFDIVATSDQRIITPDGYEGNITEIQDESVVRNAISRGSNLFAFKAADPKKAAKK